MFGKHSRKLSLLSYSHGYWTSVFNSLITRLEWGRGRSYYCCCHYCVTHLLTLKSLWLLHEKVDSITGCISVNVENIFFPRILPMCFQINIITSGEFSSFTIVSTWIRSCCGLSVKHIEVVCNSLRVASLNHIIFFREVETGIF